MELKMKTIGLLGVVTALMFGACGGDDDTPTRVPPTATAVPGVSSTATPVTPSASGPRGTLNVIEDIGRQIWVQRLTIDAARMYVQEGLLRQEHGTLNIIPNVAEEWKTTLNPDGSVDWYFKLREGIQYHGGWGEVVASDVKFSVVQHLKEGSIGTNSSAITGWFDEDPDNFEVLSKYEFEVHASEANALIWPFLSQVSASTVTPISQKHFEQVGEDGFNNDPVGTGPWEFVEQARGQSDTFRAFTENFRKVPEFAELVVLSVPEPSTAIAMVRTGQIDITRFPNKLAKEVETAGVKIIKNPAAVESFIIFGGMFLPTRDSYDPTVPWAGENPTNERPRMVRQAMNLAVDRQAIIDAVFLGEGVPMAVTFAFPPTAAYYDPAWTPYPYDPERAKDLLAQAGYPNGFEINAWSISIYNPDLMTAVVGFLEEIGITVNNRLIEYRPTVRTALVERTSAGHIYNFFNTVTNPIAYAGRVGGPSSATILHTESEFMDLMFPPIFKELDEAKRTQLIRELGAEYYRQYWTMPLTYTPALFAVGDKVRAWSPLIGISANRVYNLEFAVPAG